MLRTRVVRAVAAAAVAALALAGLVAAPAHAARAVDVPRVITGHVWLGDTSLSAGAGEVTITAKRENWHTWPTATATTDANGDYTLNVTASARYTVTYTYNGTGPYSSMVYPQATFPQGDLTYVDARYADRSGIDMILPSPKTLSGVIYVGDLEHRAGAGDVEVRYMANGGSWSDPVLTTADGRYTFPSLPAGPYRVSAVHVTDAYQARQYTGAMWSGAVGSGWVYMIGFDKTSADIFMPEYITVKGTVFLGDATHPAGAGDAQVSMVYTEIFGEPVNLGPVPTDAQGRFSFGHLRPGGYELTYTPTLPGFSSVSRFVNGEGMIDRADGVLPEDLGTRSYLIGRIVAPSLAPVPDADIYLTRVCGDTVCSSQHTVTSLDGDFRFVDTEAGLYVLEVEAEGYAYSVWEGWSGYYYPRLIEITDGQQLTLHDLKIYRAARIFGTVTAPGAPASDFAAGAFDVEVMVFDYQSFKFVGTGDKYPVLADGSYEIPDLHPDGYQLLFRYHGIGTASATSYSLGLASGETLELDMVITTPRPLTVTRAPLISGTFRVGSTVTTDAGAFSPLATSVRYQWMRDGMPIAAATTSAYKLTAADLGHHITSQVAGLRSTYQGKLAVSAPSPAVLPGTFTAPVPTIAGVVRVGSTLTVKPGTWPAGSVLTYQWRVNGVAVAGATSTTFVPAPVDYSKKVTVSVTGTRSPVLVTTKTSAATVPVASTAFSNTTLPTITGTPQVGVPLTADIGPWTPATTTWAYRWYANGVAIKGAMAATFTPTGAQLGMRLSVKVTGLALGYTTTVTGSTLTGVVLPGVYAATPPPSVSGDQRVGAVLTANTSGWQSGNAFSYQWYANGVAILYATKSTYVPIASQLGKTITVRIITTTSGYPRVSRMSAATAAVGPGVFTTVVTPTITGTARYGYTLTAARGTWSPAASYRYQWYSDGVPIAGATGSTLTLTLARLGTQISVVVTGSRAGYTTESRESLPTTAVTGRPFVASPVPTISGTMKVGSTLSALRGTWSPSGTFAYQWYADGVAIDGSTRTTIALTAGQSGKRISVMVTGYAPGYLTTQRTSLQTVAVVP